MATRLRKLGDVTDGAWDAFVRNTPWTTFFQLSPWRRVIERAFGHATHYALAEQDGVVAGVLPPARMRAWLFGDALVSTPFCVYGGPVAATLEAAAVLEAHALESSRQTGAPCLEFRDLHAPNGMMPVRSSHCYIFRRPITGDEERDMKAILRKQRAMLRRDIQNGLYSVSDRDTDKLRGVYAESVCSLGTPVFPRRCFRLLGEAFPDAHDVAHGVARGSTRGIGAGLPLPRRGAALLRRRDAASAGVGGGRLPVLGGNAPRGRAARRPAVRLRPQQGRHRRLRLQEEPGLRAATPALRLPTLGGRVCAGAQPGQPQVPPADLGPEAAAAAGGARGWALHRARAGLARWHLSARVAAALPR